MKIEVEFPNRTTKRTISKDSKEYRIETRSEEETLFCYKCREVSIEFSSGNFDCTLKVTQDNSISQLTLAKNFSLKDNFTKPRSIWEEIFSEWTSSSYEKEETFSISNTNELPSSLKEETEKALVILNEYLTELSNTVNFEIAAFIEGNV